MIVILAMMLVSGCGDEEGTSTDDASAVTQDTGNRTATGNGEADAAEIPDDIDFMALGEDFVAAAADGDCETFADLQGWSEANRNREVSISNCELVTGELDELGEPTATSSREEGLSDDEVQVWVTRTYADNSEWEMQMIIRKSTATNRDEGWVVSTFSY